MVSMVQAQTHFQGTHLKHAITHLNPLKLNRVLPPMEPLTP